MHWLYLIAAIIGEIIGTTALTASNGFSSWGWGVLALGSYGVSFVFLSFALKIIPVGIAYAVWSGVGIAAIAILGVALFGQKLDWPAILGLSLIIAGVLVLNLFSQSSSH
ncbi:MAG: DMT family transporter [Mangrovicoccus sp.]